MPKPLSLDELFADEQAERTPNTKSLTLDELFDEPKEPIKKESSIISDIGDTVKQYWDQMNPVKIAQGVQDTVAGMPWNIPSMIKSYGVTNQKIAEAAIDAFKKDDPASGFRHSINYLLQVIPGLGSTLDTAGDKVQQGDTKGAIADTAALASQIALGKVGPKALDIATEPGAISGPLSKAAALPAKAAQAITSKIPDAELARDIVGVISPRAAHGMNVALKTSKVIKKLGEKFEGANAEVVHEAPATVQTPTSIEPSSVPPPAPISPLADKAAIGLYNKPYEKLLDTERAFIDKITPSLKEHPSPQSSAQSPFVAPANSVQSSMAGKSVEQLLQETLDAKKAARQATQPVASTPEPSVLESSGSASKPKPLYKQSLDDLRKAEIEAKGQDMADLVELFGEEGAAKYSRLQRTANGPTEKADLAYKEVQAMEEALSPAQRDKLFGVDDTRPSFDSIKDYRQALEQIDPTSIDTLADSLKYSITKLDATVDPAKMSHTQHVALAQIRYGYEQAAQHGYSSQALTRAVIEKAAGRWKDPADAAFMLQHLKDLAQSIKPPIKPTQAASLPAQPLTPATPKPIDPRAPYIANNRFREAQTIAAHWRKSGKTLDEVKAMTQASHTAEEWHTIKGRDPKTGKTATGGRYRKDLPSEDAIRQAQALFTEEETQLRKQQAASINTQENIAKAAKVFKAKTTPTSTDPNLKAKKAMENLLKSMGAKSKE